MGVSEKDVVSTMKQIRGSGRVTDRNAKIDIGWSVSVLISQIWLAKVSSILSLAAITKYAV